MFRDIVSNLSLSPAASSQLAFYWRRLKREQLTRQLSAFMAVGLIVIQVATMVAPPTAANAASSNDIIYGGFSSRAQLLQIYDADHDSIGHGGYHQLFAHFGIDRNDLAGSVHQNVSSSNHSIKSIGRNPHSALDQPFTAGGGLTYYLRPLYTWGDNISYPMLVGHRHGDNAWFAVMEGCGNIAIADTSTPPTVVGSTPQPTTPYPTPTPTPTPTPAPAPTAPTPVTPTKPIETPIKPPAPVQPTQTPTITLSKSGLLTPAAGGPIRNANGATAQPGDIIEYTLTTTNSGKGAAKDYVVSDNINDILEYADLIDPRGGVLFNNSITWPKTTIKPGSSFLTTFQVRVKNPLPTTPTSVSDPQSYDFKMDDVYGNLVSVNLAVPAQAQVAVASKQLPQTGAGTDTLIVFTFAAAIAYFYFRNRQLVLEIDLLRGDHYGKGEVS
jgi:uncharacterized repeat protein (TIGR01451 family)